MSKKKRSHGEGTIYWDSNKKSYRGEISLGHHPDGRRNRIRCYGKTKSEIRDKFKAALDEHKHGIKSDRKYTLRQAINDWFDFGLTTQSHSTKSKLKTLANNHIIPQLGEARLIELNAETLDKWLKGLSANLATRTLSDIHSIVKRSISRAQGRDKVLRNVAELVNVPSGRKGRPSKSLSQAQTDQLLKSSKGWMRAYLFLSILSGIRTEEARALQWKHVHLQPSENCSCGENHSTIQTNTISYVEIWRSVRKGGDTKTKLSRRTLALPEVVVSVLKCWKEEQSTFHKRNNYPSPTLVFGTRENKVKGAREVRRRFKLELAKAGLPQNWTPRELRHSFASLMSLNGARLEEISRIMGHSDLSTTEGVYRHELRPVLTEGAEALGELFNEN